MNSKIEKNGNKKTGTRKMKVSLKDIVEMKRLSENPIPVLETKTEDEIAAVLSRASFEYYKGSPIFTDEIFDIIKDYLQKKNPKHPVLEQIGAETYGEKVELPYFMGSLDKVRENEAALDKWKMKYTGLSIVSDKLDGNSALLVVKDSKYKLYSRGDGAIGQDISHLIPYLKNIPKGLTSIAVRGELIISKENWLKNKKGANARNAVAGVMHSKKPDRELASVVDFVVQSISQSLLIGHVDSIVIISVSTLDEFDSGYLAVENINPISSHVFPPPKDGFTILCFIVLTPVTSSHSSLIFTSSISQF